MITKGGGGASHQSWEDKVSNCRRKWTMNAGEKCWMRDCNMKSRGPEETKMEAAIKGFFRGKKLDSSPRKCLNKNRALAVGGENLVRIRAQV